MKNKYKLRINQEIELEIGEGPYQGTYLSKISEINDDKLKIMPPYIKGVPHPLGRNMFINIYFTGENSSYKFKTKIIERIKEPVPLIVVLPPRKVVRIQRRDYFRLEVKRKVKYRRVDRELEPIEDFIETTTVDISGGGIRMILSEDLAIGTFIELFLNLKEVDNIPLIGKIVQLYDLPDGKAAGVEFVDINPKVRDLIVGWLFDYQRKLRHKGLL